MKVSVSIITYNQERFIGKTLDSVLMQEVDFEYEIVIGEDCSTDDTRKILLDYRKRHPDRIRLLLAEKNQGLVRNFVQTYNACKGEYVATLDGDDYWTSPDKLKKQVNFLDNNREHSMCFHPVTMVFEDGNKPNRIYPEIQGEAFSLDDILLANFIPTSAVMFRNGVFGNFPEWYHSFKIAEDWSLYVLLAQRGKLGFLKEPMGVYRFHSNSTWSMQDEVTRCKENITFYRCMKQHLGGSHGKIIDDMLDKQFFRIASLYEENDNHEMAKAYVRKAFSRPFSSRTRLIDKIKMAIRLYLPSWYRFMKGRA